MKFKWVDYIIEYSRVVDSWIDPEAKRFTGCDDGWDDFFDYWSNYEHNKIGENFWGKVVFEGSTPFAVIALGMIDDKEFVISEYIVDPQKRGKGYGTAALRELITNSAEIIGKDIRTAEAVIYPNNIASQKAFEKAGFCYSSMHPDGDAANYTYKKSLY